MLIKDLPSKRKEVVLYKIQVFEMFCWKELPKAYSIIDEAREKIPTNAKARIVKRSDKGWEIVEETQ